MFLESIISLIYFFDNTHVSSKNSLTSSYNNSIVFQIDKVYYGVQIGFFKMLIDVDNKKVSLI